MSTLQLFPGEDELSAFEATYAGPQTEALEKRHAVYERNPMRGRNSLCLVCLEEVHDEFFGNPANRVCHTCPRVMHNDCLRFKIDRLTDKDYCPLCCKRGWHVIEPALSMRRLQGDDLLMKRTARKVKWDETFRESKHMAMWQTFHDDGSLESDRQLLVDLKLVKLEHLKGARVVSEQAKEVKQETRGVKRKSSSAHERPR